MAERQFGPYKLVRQIAVGGMAEIHLAKTAGIAGFEKYVALKMIHPNFAEDDQFIQMLVDEAKIAVQLTHGNIAQTFDLGRVGETYYITMEYVDGADLYKILRRASEQDLEMPLDVCAFVGKEVASALDHAHRKKDHIGKPLGIVHRDVSPQNVLISYSGEVKLVDFGIAKATMKARQTAVGVIKGKYYYMSPEQAWGDPIDFRSDIFSAGIVLYEMITGQMLYLEEDLHKLLDMARKAEIEPPSKLRKGVPPQLERIIMHALAKVPGERYQSAGDFATDLERFLHTYSPVFTAGKISQLIKQVIGEPMQVPDEQKFPSVEFRDGLNSTHALSDADLAGAADRDNLRDENSVIFRVAELKPPPLDETAPMKKQPAAAKAMHAATSRALKKTEPPKIPSILPPAPKPPTPAKPLPVRAPLKPRKAHEETRQLIGAAPPDPNDDGSGLLTVDGKKHLPRAWDSTDTDPGRTDLPDDLENIGERTLITAMPGAASGLGFMMDAGDDAIDATMVSHGPPIADPDTDQHASAEEDALEPDDGLGDPFDPDGDEDGPTLARELVPVTRPTARNRAQPPPALAAKIHAPAVSSLRQPKASRRTPPGGSPQANVLQQIVSSRASEPMPVPAPPRHHEPPPPQFPMATPGGQPAMNYNTDASGMPLGLPTPPSGMAVSHQPYVHMQGVPPGYPQYQQGHPGYPVQPQYPQVDSMQMAQTSPQALYGMSHHPVQPMTLTGQMRLFEVDEIPAQYKLGAARRRWFTYIVAGMLAISVAAIATFLIIRATRENPSKTAGVIVVESVPAGAEVYYDNQRLAGTTPMTIDEVPLGTRHDIRVELPKHKPYLETVDVSKAIGEAKVSATLKIVTGKLVINSRPGGAEIRINGEVRGRTPGKIEDLDMGAAKKLELRLKDYQPYIEDLKWPADGEIQLDIPLQR